MEKWEKYRDEGNNSSDEAETGSVTSEVPPPTPPKNPGRAFYNRRTTIETTQKPRVRNGNEFDGTRSDYRSWRRQLRLHFAANKKDLCDDESKILCALSSMTGGLALKWAEEYMDKVNDVNPNWGRWVDFDKLLEKTFADPHEGQQAQHELETLRQGTQTAEEYFMKLLVLAKRAGYEKDHEAYLINLVERQLNQGLVDKVYASDVFPSTLEGWMEKSVSIDRLWRRRQDRKQQLVNLGVLKAKDRVVPKFTPSLVVPTLPPVVTGTGRTYQGAGKPMDVDRSTHLKEGRCFLCHEKGHMARDHKKGAKPPPYTQAREITLDGLSEESKKALFEVLMKEKEEKEKKSSKNDSSKILAQDFPSGRE